VIGRHQRLSSGVAAPECFTGARLSVPMGSRRCVVVHGAAGLYAHARAPSATPGHWWQIRPQQVDDTMMRSRHLRALALCPCGGAPQRGWRLADDVDHRVDDSIIDSTRLG
jgi:hypothetical protein